MRFGSNVSVRISALVLIPVMELVSGVAEPMQGLLLAESCVLVKISIGVTNVS